ncbi:HNH endonuclease signature motif containing protein [Novosphingobium sp. KN65.2]|uniref:HNH endonuclease signature motif containing protein n=1 Tax=Novosphingobium sp. KN65.2 TaxID=1478134 RepID=UPI0005E7CA2F|nr:conserved hypothetical protein [Novosphingobium sp. KN65.2]
MRNRAWPYNTAAWRRLREAHLSLEPECRHCALRGVLTMASHVDHITAISEGGLPFPSHDGLQSLCLPCHSRKTARGGEAGAVSTNKPMKGCDAKGDPIDPAHPWKSLRAEGRVARRSLKNQLVSRIRRG